MAVATHKTDLGHEAISAASAVGVPAGHHIAVEIRSPEGSIWSGMATSLQVPESLGLMGILPRHAALLATLVAGLTTIHAEDGRTVKIITGDGFLEIGKLLALKQADAAQQGEVLLRARKVVHHQVRLSDVLVRAAVPRIELDRALVVFEREVHLLEIAVGIAEIVVQVGAVR